MFKKYTNIKNLIFTKCNSLFSPATSLNNYIIFYCLFRIRHKNGNNYIDLICSATFHTAALSECLRTISLPCGNLSLFNNLPVHTDLIHCQCGSSFKDFV